MSGAPPGVAEYEGAPPGVAEDEGAPPWVAEDEVATRVEYFAVIMIFYDRKISVLCRKKERTNF